MQIKERLVSRFSRPHEGGMSIEEAWKVIAVETRADAGLVEPEPLERVRVHAGPRFGQVPVLETKLVKVARIEPADANRIKTLVAE